VQLNSFADELKALSLELNKKLAQSKAEQSTQALNNRLDGATITMTYQQIQIYFLFLLLILNSAIDAGMTAMWLMPQAWDSWTGFAKRNPNRTHANSMGGGGPGVWGRSGISAVQDCNLYFW
jgi:hypothetical protein